MKGGEFVLLEENTTQWKRFYNSGGECIFRRWETLFRSYLRRGRLYCLRGGDFLWGGSITQHRRYGRQAKLPTSRHSLYRRRLAASMPRSAAVLCAYITQLPTAYIGVSLQCVALAGEGIQTYEINNFVPAPCRKFNTSTGRKHARFNTLRCLLRRYTTVCEPGHTLESYEKYG